MKALTPAALTRATGLFAYSALPFPRPTQYITRAAIPTPTTRSVRWSLYQSPQRHRSFKASPLSSMLPTPPLGDAVTFGYKVTTHSDRDFHPADKASSRTHWMAGTSPAMTKAAGYSGLMPFVIVFPTTTSRRGPCASRRDAAGSDQSGYQNARRPDGRLCCRVRGIR